MAKTLIYQIIRLVAAILVLICGLKSNYQEATWFFVCAIFMHLIIIEEKIDKIQENNKTKENKNGQNS